MRFLFLFFSLLILIGTGSAQSLKQYIESINGYLIKEDYYAAYHDLELALTYEKDMDSLHMLAGNCAYQLNAFGRAVKHYKAIINLPITERHPNIEFYLAESLFRQGMYGEALIYFKAYQASEPEGSNESEIVKTRINSIHWAKENLKKKDPLIQSKKLDESVNTVQNEFSPSFFENALYISSQNIFEKSKKAVVPRNSGTILKYKESNLELMESEKGLIEQDVHMVHPTFSKDGSKVYFSICAYQEDKDKLICQIYVKFKQDGKWGSKIKLTDPVNIPKYSSTQAHLTTDTETGLEKLYFVSDRPGGKGGFDIYSVLLNDNDLPTTAENLDYINTIEDEVSPYYNLKQEILYFSSNGHIGFGGHDVYRYAFKGKESRQIVNMGPSVNCSYDDLYYIEDDIQRKAYMVSNKPSSLFLDETIQACCYDVYRVKFLPASLDLLVNTYDQYDSSFLKNVRVSITDITETDSSYFSGESAAAGNCKLKILEDRKYRIIGSKAGWISDTVQCDATDLESLEQLVRNLYLVELKTLNALTFERTTNHTLKGVTVELWDMDNGILLKSATNPDSNFYDFTLLKGKNYKLSASKPKYESTTILITPQETAAEPVLLRKLFLELTAIADLRRLLPIRLFFENDMPNPRSESDTTDLGFLDIYNDYFNRKNTYIAEFTKGMRGLKKEQAMLNIDTFFNQNVKANAEKLKLFMDKLIIILEEGHEIDIFLKGYASPRAKSEYNHLLSSRRVTSVRNEFDRYNRNVFHDYIKSTFLQIKEIPFGESQSSSDVSDDLADTRNSIYNLKAAYERRVEILEILKGIDETPKL